MLKGKSKGKSFFEKIEAEVVSEAEDYLNYKTEKVKKKFLKIGEISLFVILSFFLISFGIANLLESNFVILKGGFGYIVVGMVFLFMSFAIRV